MFATSGVDAPAKEIAELAGVGVGTLYRHFPQRSDLVVAVLEREIDACAEAGPALSAAHEPGEALTRWLDRYTDFVATKRGLAAALHSGDPAFDALPGYFLQRLGPVLSALLDAAEVRADISAKDLLYAVALLCHPVPGGGPSTAGGWWRPGRRPAPRLGCARGRPIERQRERSNSSATARMCASTSASSSRTPGESRAPGRVMIANVS